MQAITFRLVAAFARTPSIRFLGPRDQIKRSSPPPTPITPTQPKASLGSIGEGPGVRRSEDLEIKLEGWQIDAINSGGVIDLKYQKVKPISLRKRA